jgi:hypothetical protein
MLESRGRQDRKFIVLRYNFLQEKHSYVVLVYGRCEQSENEYKGGKS